MSFKARLQDRMQWLVHCYQSSETLRNRVFYKNSVSDTYLNLRNAVLVSLSGNIPAYVGVYLYLCRYVRSLRWLMALLLLASSSPASAHSDLQVSTPAAGEEMSIIPSKIELIFSQALREQSQISLARPNFEFVGGISSAITGEDRNVLRATLPTLSPGVYTVHWVSIAEDGDMLRGSYSFSVKEGAVVAPDQRWKIVLGLSLLLCVVLAGLVFVKRYFQTK